MSFNQLPEILKAKILYEFKGLETPTAVLIKNIKKEMESYEGYTQAIEEYYNNKLELGWIESSYMVDNEFINSINWYKDICNTAGVPQHVLCRWDEFSYWEEK
jgi:hypothetical protein